MSCETIRKSFTAQLLLDDAQKSQRIIDLSLDIDAARTEIMARGGSADLNGYLRAKEAELDFLISANIIDSGAEGKKKILKQVGKNSTLSTQKKIELLNYVDENNIDASGLSFKQMEGFWKKLGVTSKKQLQESIKKASDSIAKKHAIVFSMKKALIDADRNVIVALEDTLGIKIKKQKDAVPSIDYAGKIDSVNNKISKLLEEVSKKEATLQELKKPAKKVDTSLSKVLYNYDSELEDDLAILGSPGGVGQETHKKILNLIWSKENEKRTEFFKKYGINQQDAKIKIKEIAKKYDIKLGSFLNTDMVGLSQADFDYIFGKNTKTSFVSSKLNKIKSKEKIEEITAQIDQLNTQIADEKKKIDLIRSAEKDSSVIAEGKKVKYETILTPENIAKVNSPFELMNVVRDGVEGISNEALDAIRIKLDDFVGNVTEEEKKIAKVIEEVIESGKPKTLGEFVDKVSDSLKKTIYDMRVMGEVTGLTAEETKQVKRITDELAVGDKTQKDAIKAVDGLKISEDSKLSIIDGINNLSNKVEISSSSDMLLTAFNQRGNKASVENSVYFDYDAYKRTLTPLQGDEEKLAALYKDVYNSNKIEISSNVDYADTLEGIKSSGKKSIIVANESAFDSPVITQLRKEGYSVVYAKGKGSMGFQSDGKSLFVSSYNKNVLAREVAALNKVGLSPNLVSENAGKTTQNILDLIYGKDSENALAMITSMRGEKNAIEIQRMLDVVSEISPNHIQDYFDVDDIMRRLPNDKEFYIDAIKEKLGTTVDENIVFVTDDLKRLYISATYGKTIADIENGKDLLAQTYLMGYNPSSLESNAYDLWKELYDKVGSQYNGFDIPREGFLDFIKGFMEGNIADDFLGSLFSKNKGLNAVFTEDEIIDILKGFEPKQQSIKTGIPESGFLFKEQRNPFAKAVKGELTASPTPIMNDKLVVSGLQNEVDSILDEWYNLVKKELVGGINQQRGFEIKKLLQSRLRQFESKAINSFDGAISKDLIRTNVYEVYKITGQGDVQALEASLQNLKGRYKETLENIDSMLNKANDATIKDGLMSDGAVLISQNNKRMYVTIDDAIKYELERLPKGVGDVGIYDGYDLSKLSKSEKQRVYTQIRLSKLAADKNRNLLETIYVSQDPSLENFFKTYQAPEGELPLALQSNITKLDPELDTEAKKSILKRVTMMTERGTLTPDSLESVVDGAVAKIENMGINADGVREQYFRVFMPYTRLYEIPKDVISSASKLMNPVEITPFESEVIGGLRLSDGTPVASVLGGSVDSSMPKVFYKTKKYEISTIKGELKAADIAKYKRDVEKSVDAIFNGYTVVDDLVNNLGVNLRGAAFPLMSEGRLKALRDLHGVVDGKAEKASNAIKNRLFDQAQGYINFFLGRGAVQNVIDDKLLKEFIDSYKEMINSPEDIFRTKDYSTLSKGEQIAYDVADYVRDLTQGLSKITTSEKVNKQIANDIVNSVSKITKGNEALAVASAIRNFTPFSMTDALGTQIKAGTDIGLEEFNKLFNANLSRNDYLTITSAVQGLNTGLLGNGWVAKFASKFHNFITSPINKNLMSIGSQYTYLSQVPGYASYVKNLEKQFGKNSGAGLSLFRLKYGILTAEGADFVSAVPFLVKAGIAKNDIEAARILGDKGIDVIKNFDPDAMKLLAGQGFDNGNNILDGIFANPIKNASLLSAIQNNDMLPMKSFEQFIDFIESGNVPQKFKDELIREIEAKSVEHYQSMMSVGGTSLFKNQFVGNTGMVNRVVDLLNNPINFRGSLGVSKFKSNVEQITRAGDVISRGLKMLNKNGWTADNVAKISKAIANDFEIRHFVMTIMNDTASAIRYVRFQEQGKDIEDREIGVDDYWEAFQFLSNNWQVMQSAGFMRIINASIDAKEGNGVAAGVQAYMRNMFVPLKIMTTYIDWVNWHNEGGWENWSERFFEGIAKSGTGGLRRAQSIMETNSSYMYLPADRGGLGSIFGQATKAMEFGADRGDDKITLLLEKQGANPFIRDKEGFLGIGFSPVGQALINQTRIKGVYDALGRIIDGKPSPRIGKEQFQDRIDQYAPYKEFEARGYKLATMDTPITYQTSKIDRDINTSRFSLLGGYNGPGTDYEYKTMEKFDKGEEIYNANLSAIYKAMQEKGVFNKRLNDLASMKNTKNKQAIYGARSMIEFIDEMGTDAPLGSDLVKLESNVNLDFNTRYDGFKKIKSKAKQNVTREDREEIQRQVVNRYLGTYQQIASNGSYSRGAFNQFMTEAVKKDPKYFEGFAKIEKVSKGKDESGDEIFVDKVNLDYKWQQWQNNKNAMNAEIAKGKDPIAAMKKYYGVQNFFTDKDKGIAVGVAALAMKDLHDMNMTDEEINDAKVKMFVNIGKNVGFGKEIRTLLGDELYNEYKGEFYQTYKDAVKDLNNIEAGVASGGAGKKKKIADLKKMSDIIKKLASDKDSHIDLGQLPKPSNPGLGKIRQLSDKDVADTMFKGKVQSAQSETYFTPLKYSTSKLKAISKGKVKALSKTFFKNIA